MDERLLDETNRQLLAALQRDGRASYRELGDLVGLSPPAVADRVKRLEEAGVIVGYRAIVDLEKVGRPLMATVRVGPTTKEECNRLEAWAAEQASVLRCWRVTGEDCYHMVVAVSGPTELHHLLDGVMEYGPSNTSLVLSQPFDHAIVEPYVPAETAG